MSRYLRQLLTLLLALGLSACAGQTLKADAAQATLVQGQSAAQAHQPQHDGDALAVTHDTPATSEQDQAAAHAPEPHAHDHAQASTDALPPTQAEYDFADIYGSQPPYDPAADGELPEPAQLGVAYDPWEPFNRRMHAINNAMDKHLGLPIAQAYVAIVPEPVRTGVGNFFVNLGQPVSALNMLLQGRPGHSAQALGRFVVNATVGLGGVLDPATAMGLPLRSEDFGQTLALWGWRRSRYLELPLFGPRTLRDVLGMSVDGPLSPMRQIADPNVRIPLQFLMLVDIRTQLMSIDAMREGAADSYSLMRDAWLQRRNYQIDAHRQIEREQSLPEYLQEDEPVPTLPADALPVSVPGV